MKIGKRKIFLIIGLIVLVLAACSNVDGDLDDKWQLRQYQYADGSIERQDSIFYNFQKGSFSAICLLKNGSYPVSYTHLRAHETLSNLVWRRVGG